MLENNYYSYDKYGFLMNEPLTGSLYELLAEKKRGYMWSCLEKFNYSDICSWWISKIAAGFYGSTTFCYG